MIDPEKARDFYLKAEAASDIRRFEAAQTNAAQALAFCPSEPDYHASLARACLGLSQLADAERHCLSGLALDAEHVWLLKILVIVTRALEKEHESIAHGERLVALAPDLWESHLQLAKSCLVRKRFRKAIEHCKEARKLAPDNSQVKLTLGNCYLDLDKPALAESEFREALAIDPNNASTLNNLGVSLLRQEKVKDASLAFKAAIVIDPNLSVAKNNMKTSVGSYLSVAVSGAGFLLFYMFAKFAVTAGRHVNVSKQGGSGDEILVIAAVVALALIVVIGLSLVVTKWMRKRELNSADPQIMEIYNAVCKDSNAE